MVWKLKVTYCPCKTLIHRPGKGVITVPSVREGRAPAISNPNTTAVNTAGFFQLIYSLQWVFRLTGQLALLHKTSYSGSMLRAAPLCSAIDLQGNSSIHNSVRYKKIKKCEGTISLGKYFMAWVVLTPFWRGVLSTAPLWGAWQSSSVPRRKRTPMLPDS